MTDRSARQSIKHPQRHLKWKDWHIASQTASCDRNARLLDHAVNANIVASPRVVGVKNAVLARIVGGR